MSNIDLTPLYRTMVGFDRMATMIDTASRLDGTQGYPPYNIERSGENAFAIEIAVAGFTDADLDIETKEGQLTGAGKKGENEVRELPEEKKPRKIAIGSHTEASEPRLIGKKAAGNAA